MSGNNGNSNKQFVWSYEGGSKAFPIDYSMTEFSKQFLCDARTLKKGKVLNSPLFRDTLSLLLTSGSLEDIPIESKDSYPIPLESRLFLEELVKLEMDSKDYKAVLAGKKDVSSKKWQEKKQRFVKQAFQNLCNRVSKEDGDLETTFNRRVLMANSDFAETILSDLWESQLTDRVKRLKECAKNASFEVQADVLDKCFRMLDMAAFELACYEQQEKQSTDGTEPSDIPEQLKSLRPLRKVLTDLLAVRIRAKEEGKKLNTPGSLRNVHASYCLDNVAVGDIDMERAFEALKRSTHDETFLEQTREAYWRSLLLEKTERSFENNYLRMRKYLEDSTATVSKAELRKTVISACVEQTRDVIDQHIRKQVSEMEDPHISINLNGSTLKASHVGLTMAVKAQTVEYLWSIINKHVGLSLPDPCNPLGLTSNQYIYQFVMSTVQAYPYRFVNIFKDTFELLLVLAQCSERFEKETDIEPIDELSPPERQQYVERFERYFITSWQYLCRNGMLVEEIENPFDNIAVSAKILAKGINDSLEFLDITQDRRTDEDIQKKLKKHMEARAHSSSTNICDYIVNCDMPLLKDIILMIQHMIARDVEKILLKVLPKFITIQPDKKEDN